ncbi:MAG: PorT family protein [Muribaculaceae bacterium]|nr:PorT family protein [Muribaculaceae bacterium]
MKDRWLNDINKKMSEFEAGEPAGLWENIDAGIHQAHTSGWHGSSLLHSWRPWAAAAIVGASAGIAAIVANISGDKTNIVSSAEEIAEIGIEIETQPETDLLLTNPGTNAPISDKRVKNPSIRLYQSVEDRENPDSVSLLSRETEDNVGDNSISHEEVVNNSDGRVSSKKKSTRSSSYRSSRRRKEITIKDDSKFKIGAYASGRWGGGDVKNGGGIDRDSYIASTPSSSDEISTVALNEAGKMRHNMPMKFGLTFGWQIIPHLTIGTGISYSYLSSDFNNLYFNDHLYLRANQKLHYLGIPIFINYNFATWRMLSFYGMAGAYGEKLVSGKVSGENKTDYRSFSVKEKELQWSVNAGLGAQLNVSQQFGIYLEPSVAYYFDNHSMVVNVYKERPINFVLTLGVRFNFGK